MNNLKWELLEIPIVPRLLDCSKGLNIILCGITYAYKFLAFSITLDVLRWCAKVPISEARAWPGIP